MSSLPTLPLRSLARVAPLAVVLAFAPGARALQPAPNGWYVTGSATHLDGRIRDYTLVHEMRSLPVRRVPSRRVAVIEADVDKRFTLWLHRPLPCASLKSTLRDAFARNGFTQTAKITQAIDTCSGSTLRARSQVVIAYEASTKTTTFWVEGMGKATVVGVDFMRAAWSLWLGNVPQPKLREALVARM